VLLEQIRGLDHVIVDAHQDHVLHAHRAFLPGSLLWSDRSISYHEARFPLKHEVFPERVRLPRSNALENRHRRVRPATDAVREGQPSSPDLPLPTTFL
jgi:hypothetical protein